MIVSTVAIHHRSLFTQREGHSRNCCIQYYLSVFLSFVVDGDCSDFLLLFSCYYLAEGMKELRKQNIVHRDIKPQNILIKEDATIKQRKMVHHNETNNEYPT